MRLGLPWRQLNLVDGGWLMLVHPRHLERGSVFRSQFVSLRHDSVGDKILHGRNEWEWLAQDFDQQDPHVERREDEDGDDAGCNAVIAGSSAGDEQNRSYEKRKHLNLADH